MTKFSARIFMLLMLLIAFASAIYADPQVGFSFGVINTTDQLMTFTYDFTSPYAGGPYSQIQSSFSDVLIDTNFSGTSTVTPIDSAYVMNTYVDGFLVSALGLGTGCTTPSFSFICTSPDDGTIGPLPYLSAATGILELRGSFTVTPGGQYTLTGRSEFVPAVPEPSTLSLTALMLLGVGASVRRRRSVSR